MTMSILPLVLQVVATVVAAAAAIGAFLSARATKRSASAQLFLTCAREYSQPEMAAAIDVLQEWKQQFGERFAESFATAGRPVRVDDARRRVAHYFITVYELRQLGFISKRVVRTLAGQAQVQLYRELVEPLEGALNPRYDRKSFEMLGRLYGIQRRDAPLSLRTRDTP
jgi:hypothetical protein